MPTRTGVKIYGHRGAAGEAPENTLGGFRHAWDRGTRCFELDIQLTADRELVVIHDDRVNRTTGSRGAVSSLTSKELAKLDARRGTPPWPRREGIPRLSDVLRALPRAQGWQVEVKKAASPQAKELIIDRLQKILGKLSLRRRVILTSSDRSFLELARTRLPKVTRGLIASDFDPLRTAAELGCSHLLVHIMGCSPGLRLAAWRQGIALSVWGVNEPTSVKACYQMRVHSIVTDYPSMAIPLVGQLAGSRSGAGTR